MEYMKKTRIFIGIQIIFLLLISALYRGFGQQLIKAVYEGKDIPFLSEIIIIEGQALYSALHYLIKADEIFLKYLLFAFLFIGFEIIILNIINETLKDKRKTQRLIEDDKARRKQKRILAKASFVTAIIVLTSTLYLLRFEYLLHRLPVYNMIDTLSLKAESAPGLKENHAKMLGRWHTKPQHPKSSYLAYPKDKDPNVTRISILGCSFVEGSETAEGHDFPSLLQDRFNRAGFNNIEVINFGLSSGGLHQAYMLWEFLARDYNSDYVIVMPFLSHILRDDSFIYDFDKGGLHARYIIKDGKLKLIPVAGTALAEAYKIYYRIIIPWRYIRYDYKMPMFLRVLLPSCLHNIANPFYYRPWIWHEKEILKTYAMIFNNIAKEIDGLVIIASNEKIYRLRKNTSLPNVYFMKTQADIINPLYFAPQRHNSALGNQVRADELFSLLTGKKKPKIDIINLSCDSDYKRLAVSSPPVALFKYADISINI